MRRYVLGLILAAFAVPAAADLRREVEPNDPPAMAQPAVPPASLGGVISEPGDVDVFAVALQAGQTLEADILARGFRAGASPGSQLSAVLEILDRDGTTILAQDQSQGDFDDPTVTYQVTASGKYFVSVRDLSPSVGGAAYLYVLSLEVDPNDSFGTATPILPPVLPSIDALIYPPGDLDYYRFTALAGQVLTVDIDSAVFNPVQPAAKIVLTVYDASQAVLAQDAYTSSDPQDPMVQVTLPADGIYFIQVRELRSFVGTDNTFYQMSVELGPAPGNNTYTTGMPVIPPRAVSGVLSPAADADQFRFVLGAGSTVRADLDARQDLVSLLQGTLSFNDAGGVLASNSSTPDPLLSGALAAGSYSIAVEGPCTGSGCLPEDAYYLLFLDADQDGDGLYLPADNCAAVSNPSQADADRDGVGDPCDNCPAVFNPSQADADDDGIGDVCPCVRPPEVAMDLSFLDDQTLIWSGAPPMTSYNLYRGFVGAGGWGFDQACLATGLTAPGAGDPAVPPVGFLFHYMVSGSDACGEGPLGFTSWGQVRPNPSPCP